MIRNKLTVAAAGLALLVSASACDNSKLTDINRNPNGPSSATPPQLWATAVNSSVRIARGSIEITPAPMTLWPQHMGEYQYPEGSYYQLRPTFADSWWSQYYTGPLQDLEEILRQTSAARGAAVSRPNMTGPALVMRAWDYWIMTSMWGDIPFSQANKGDQGNLTPVYDTQQSIFDSLLTNLADANAMMAPTADPATPAGVSFYGADPVYGAYAGAADNEEMVTRWKRLANSMRARVALTLSNRDAARAASEISAAFAAGGLQSRADNAQINWPGDGVQDNPWCQQQIEGDCGGTRNDTRMGEALVDTMVHLNDPRLAVYARPAANPGCTDPGGSLVAGCTPIAPGGYRGMPAGLQEAEALKWGQLASNLGYQVFNKIQPSYIMTYAEYEFILAEARERGWITTGPTAAQHYINGITASMEDWGVAAGDIATYLAQPAVVYTPGAAGRAQIGVQKWIALYTQGFDAWNEWRRTGFPNLTPSANSVLPGGGMPRSVMYPQTEQSFNVTNLNAAIANNGSGAALEKRLWIDP